MTNWIVFKAARSNRFFANVASISNTGGFFRQSP